MPARQAPEVQLGQQEAKALRASQARRVKSVQPVRQVQQVLLV